MRGWRANKAQSLCGRPDTHLPLGASTCEPLRGIYQPHGRDTPLARLNEIARRIADRTNLETAATLLLSTKTVETHVRNIFHELDVSSRRQVAPVIVPA